MSLTESYLQRFSGIGRLYGMTALQKFSQSHVLVIGIGGVGSWVAEALVRSGVGHISLMDLDDICVSNINRQIHAVDNSIGISKIKAMESRLLTINPTLKIHLIETYLTIRNAEEVLAKPFSFLVDAIDSVREKAHLIATCKRLSQPIITIGGMGGRMDPSHIRSEDLSKSEGDRLLMLVRKRLRSEYGFPRPGKGKFKVDCVYSDEVPVFPLPDGSVCHNRSDNPTTGMNCDTGFGSVTHITATAAFHAVSAVLRKLASD